MSYNRPSYDENESSERDFRNRSKEDSLVNTTLVKQLARGDFADSLAGESVCTDESGNGLQELQDRSEKQKEEAKEKAANKVGADKKLFTNINKEGDNTNYKRSIEIKNGIAMRSMNNFHKTSNAINLQNYIVSVPLLLLFTTTTLLLATCLNE